MAGGSFQLRRINWRLSLAGNWPANWLRLEVSDRDEFEHAWAVRKRLKVRLTSGVSSDMPERKPKVPELSAIESS